MRDRGVMLACDRPLPDIVKRIEYYHDQRLFMLVYHNDNHEGDLLQYEVPLRMISLVQRSADVVIFTIFEGEEPIGYKVPLVQIMGDIMIC